MKNAKIRENSETLRLCDKNLLHAIGADMYSLNERIEVNPAVCHGKPVVRGTRVLVAQLLGALAGGDSIEDVLADYPSVTAEDLSAVFAFAGSLAQFEDIPYSESVVAL